MNQTVIFVVGVAIFAMTVWGSVMIGGIWMGRLGTAEDNAGFEPPVSPDRGDNPESR